MNGKNGMSLVDLERDGCKLRFQSRLVRLSGAETGQSETRTAGCDELRCPLMKRMQRRRQKTQKANAVEGDTLFRGVLCWLVWYFK